MNLTERTIEKKQIMDGKVIKVEKHIVTLPNGKESVREVVKHPGAVAILAVKDKKILFVEQFRKAMEKCLIEIPAGKVESGEERINTAKRELEEETGYTTQQLSLLNEFYVSPGFCDEYISLYYTDTLIASSMLSPDEDEFVNHHWLTLDEALQWVDEGRIEDAKTIIAILNYQLKMRK
ncbi:NUDIX hydrolase [Macrococcoides canis]|uniref:NUDIX hydrolase n=1 Tax=Macrococcoides canis TaxID=1855823 RepID=UPI0020B8AAFD|nr:NUDIX hydrolase [Macrococcus canis]UTH10589.1 NUDIX hydrolase [Macrococcus canis]